MAKWHPRITQAVEAELQAMGPYIIERSGFLAWRPAPGFEWPWGRAVLSFRVDDRSAGDADFRRLTDAWRQVCERQGEVVAALREAIGRGWKWARENVPSESLGEREESDDATPLRHVRGCSFSLRTFGAGQVSMTARIEVGWDDEHGLEVDLIEQDRRSSWSFL